jgi:hypothetical protein
MNKLILKPDGWTCTLKECPVGLFVCESKVGIKTNITDSKGCVLAYDESGQVFWGGDDDMVQPVKHEWENSAKDFFSDDYKV